MQENLNVGIKINAPELPTDNDIIEKYCMGNLSYYCISNGGLYFWNEMMNYTNETGGQGICPDGWHIPNDMDWQILEGTVDSEFKIGHSEWKIIPGEVAMLEEILKKQVQHTGSNKYRSHQCLWFLCPSFGLFCSGRILGS